MTGVLKHRGPDDEGFFVDTSVGLGFRRLSIIDLIGGHQPMANEDGTITVVFNGEIYNFRELRSELQQQGHRFSTVSDTEVIVHGYEAWGDDVVHHLNGMFALAIWDSLKRKLFLSRDRLGIKPLYYAHINNTIAFASEIKSLLFVPAVDRQVSDLGVFEYFSYHFVPGANTIYKKIFRLQPGESLVVKDGTIKTKHYWQPAVTYKTGKKIEDWTEELLHRLKEAVRLQLVADVPIGVFLSGGIDSSAITAAMSALGVQQIGSFNIGFDVPKYDETYFADLVSKQFGTTHKTFPIRDWPRDLLPKLMWYLDEPMADATIIPTYLLSQMTRQNVKVALSGEGGDELFAGYTQYQGLQLNRMLNYFPSSLRRGLVDIFNNINHFGIDALGYFWHRVAKILHTSFFPPFEAYTRKLTFFLPEQLDRLFSPDFKSRTATFPYLETFWKIQKANPHLDPMAQAGLADLTVFLPEDMLVKVDRMSMACSLEVRVPLLDHTFVEFALSIPFDLKIHGFKTKYILREALKGWLPQTIVNRRKRGFSPPLEYWLKRHLVEYAREEKIMETLSETGYFNLDYVRELLQKHVAAEGNYAQQLWSLVVFATWWRYVRGSTKSPS
jgi:asparagine synthase (glutamine-hydrolysing)